MTLFKNFGTKPKENEETIPESINKDQEIENANETSSNDEKKDEVNDSKRLITITWGTGMPIDVIFNFVHKNFEDDGFQDALVNQDITYRDAKERIIRNDLEMLFKRITLRYKNDIRTVNVKIVNARKALALAAADNLEALRETYNEHLEEINEMQNMLNANDPKMMTMIESYRRGFLKGIAATSTNFLENN